MRIHLCPWVPCVLRATLHVLLSFGAIGYIPASRIVGDGPDTCGIVSDGKR